MELGLKKDEVKIVPHHAQWSCEFERVKRSMLHILNVNEKRIEHIGSTAIKGIKAKPIIDILLGMEDLAGYQSRHRKSFTLNWILPITC